MSLLLLLACTTSDEKSATNLSACEVDGERPVSWSDESNSKQDPQDATVFDRSVIHTISITVDSADYEASYTELATLIGSEFGAGQSGPGGQGGQGGQPSQALLEAATAACKGLAAGDSCSAEADGSSISGSCQSMGADLVCVPEMGGGGGGGDATDLVGGNPSYFPVTIASDSHVWCSVGMRWKGNATLTQTWAAGNGKLPFRLDFDQFEDENPEVKNQRFYGFKEMGFGNGQGDDTLVRDVMASEILEERGLPAAHNAFYRVNLDWGEGPVYLGLYTAVEDPSDAMMSRLFEEDDGNLYKPEGTCADFTCFDEESFAKKSNEDELDWSDVEALQAALYADRSDAEAWRAGLESTFNTEEFLHWLAVNSAIENWDVYGALAHNYYLYGDPGDDGRLTWIPWDHNLSLMSGMMGSSDPMLADVSESWPLIRFLLNDPVYSNTYRQELEEAMGGAYALDTFTFRADELKALIEPELFGENGEVAGYTTLTTQEDYDLAFTALVDHVKTRQDAVNAALK